MSLPPGSVCSLLHYYSGFLSQVKPESVRVQTLRTDAVSLVWSGEMRIGHGSKSSGPKPSNARKKRDRWWKRYSSSSAFHVNDFSARLLGSNAACHKEPCRFNVSSCNFGPAVYFSFNSLAQHLSVGRMENSSVARLQPAHAKCSPRAQRETIGVNEVKTDALQLDSVQQSK